MARRLTSMSYRMDKHTRGYRATVLYFTWNRLEYTRRTLPRLIDSLPAWARLAVFDNHSRQETIDFLKSIEDRRFQLFLNKSNAGLSKPTNWIYANAQTEFVAKVDNDTLVPDGWLERMIEAHEKWGPTLGVASGFHFLPEDWNDEYEKNVIEKNGCKILRQPYVGGCCYAMRRSTFLELGPISTGDVLIGGWTAYQQITMKQAKKIIGYVFPLAFVEHLDDPRHPETRLDAGYLWQTRRMTKEQFAEFIRQDAKSLLGGNWAR